MGEEKALNVGPSADGLGHSLPRQLWLEFATHIAEHVIEGDRYSRPAISY